MKCFVIGPIGDQLAEPDTEARRLYEESLQIFAEIVTAACDQAGIEPYRADDIDDPGEIPDQIFSAIRDEDLVIADLSGANPNVMYELGLRHMTGKCTIQIGEKTRLPFDVSTIRTILFTRTPAGIMQGRKQLAKAISAYQQKGCTKTRAASIIGDVGASIKSNPHTPTGSPAEANAEEEADTNTLEEPLGTLDAAAELEEGFPDLTSKLIEGYSLVSKIGVLTKEAAGRLDEGGDNDRLEIVNSYATNLEPLARDYDVATLELGGRVLTLGPAVDLLFGLIEREQIENVAPDFIPQMIELGQAASGAVESMTSFRTNMGGVVDLSQKLRPVVRMLQRAVDRSIRDFGILVDWGIRAEMVGMSD